MKIQILKPDPSKIIRWAKGTSQELFIYPSTSVFQKRDFLFRISLATVEAETSDFTPLPGVQRTLMLLKGKHTLTHQGCHTKQLSPFDQDSFEGGWHTSSEGQAINFNLMCRPGASGKVKHIKGNAEEMLTFNLQDDFTMIYLYSGKAKIENKNFESGESLIVEKGNQLKLMCVEASDMILTSIQFILTSPK
ncbi:HutD family protein [Reichenbachiella sp.]|uniref:HutD/Ves family protein n=1 Tax=Reichenbachiella sp. TaxID=2184521 RepID=UPI003B5C4964